jgi:phosphohistidine phosphatase SixA
MDPPLNDNGLQQARLLGQTLQSTAISLVACSTLQRAKQTAEEICKTHPPLSVYPTNFLKEIDFGSVDGMDLEEARKQTMKTVRAYLVPVLVSVLPHVQHVAFGCLHRITSMLPYGTWLSASPTSLSCMYSHY